VALLRENQKGFTSFIRSAFVKRYEAVRLSFSAGPYRLASQIPAVALSLRPTTGIFFTNGNTVFTE
jgi:hypothetical protein